MTTLGRDAAALRALGALWTAREIVQQPAMLRATHAALTARKAAIEAYLGPLLGARATRVILTGAGTSAFIGECLAPLLAGDLPCRVEAIATTDLVAAPHLYFEPRTPTLLVSFARSGNSPESVAAVDLAEQCVGTVHHLALTCNRQGALARRIAEARRGLAFELPEATHDQGFAMTSSFSSMLLAGQAALCGIAAMATRMEHIARATEAVIASQAEAMRRLAASKHERVVYLGSHGFKGLAREAALKMLELTDGAAVAIHDSPLGFRHGPKTIVEGRTLVVVFLSSHDYTRRYDLDLLDEIRREGRAGGLLAICAREEGIPAGVDRILVPGLTEASDADLLIPFVAAPQILAFEQSIARGRTPDRPNASGTVNRVVQGVRIHPWVS